MEDIGDFIKRSGNASDWVRQTFDRAIENVAKPAVDMRELSPDAPRATSNADRCSLPSQIWKDCRCILRKGHIDEGFYYCQFEYTDRTERLKEFAPFADHFE